MDHEETFLHSLHFTEQLLEGTHRLSARAGFVQAPRQANI